MQNNSASPDQKVKLITSACLCLTALGIQLLVYLLFPGYITGSLLNSAKGVSILALSLVWQLLGYSSLFFGNKSTMIYIVKICLVLIFCTLPGILVLTLGPAIVTITNAVGPILEGDKP